MIKHMAIEMLYLRFVRHASNRCHTIVATAHYWIQSSGNDLRKIQFNSYDHGIVDVEHGDVVELIPRDSSAIFCLLWRGAGGYSHRYMLSHVCSG